jgi:alpha-1,3-rhamnosyl/mannosyltransferase
MSRPLHIVLDARWIFPKLSGIGLYTQELIAGLTRCPGPHRYTLLFRDPEVMARTAAVTGFTRHTAFTGHLVRGGPFAPSGQLTLPLLLRRLNADVYHSTNYMMPLASGGGARRVVTLHDLIPLLFRDHAPRALKNRFFPVFRFILHTVAREADRIIAVSDATRRDILAHLPVPSADADKVVVIAEGVQPGCVPAPRPPRNYVQFLYVGRRDPYKNLPLLIRAYAALCARDLPVRLRVVGAEDPRYPEAEQTARALGVFDRIDWSGYVSDPELRVAYQQADVYVLPSRYEGFGLPVLEAMACGTPVICSNTSSLPEVAGDAALLIDPDREETLIDAMDRLARDPAARADLTARGLAQAARFTWDDTARTTLALYEQTAG